MAFSFGASAKTALEAPKPQPLPDNKKPATPAPATPPIPKPKPAATIPAPALTPQGVQPAPPTAAPAAAPGAAMTQAQFNERADWHNSGGALDHRGLYTGGPHRGKTPEQVDALHAQHLEAQSKNASPTGPGDAFTNGFFKTRPGPDWKTEAREFNSKPGVPVPVTPQAPIPMGSKFANHYGTGSVDNKAHGFSYIGDETGDRTAEFHPASPTPAAPVNATAPPTLAGGTVASNPAKPVPSIDQPSSLTPQTVQPAAMNPITAEPGKPPSAAAPENQGVPPPPDLLNAVSRQQAHTRPSLSMADLGDAARKNAVPEVHFDHTATLTPQTVQPAHEDAADGAGELSEEEKRRRATATAAPVEITA